MHKFRLLTLVILFSLLFGTFQLTVLPGKVNAEVPWCWCTTYVANRIGITSYPDAKDWDNNGTLANAGFQQISAPAIGAVVVMEAGYPNADDVYGHVGVVDAYNSNTGIVTLRGANQSGEWNTEYNCRNVTSKVGSVDVRGRNDISFWYRPLNRFFQTIRGTDDGIYTRQNVTDTSWTDWTYSGATHGDVDTEEYLGTTLQAMRGSNDLIYTRQYQNDTWGNWSVDGMTETVDDVEIEIFNNKVYEAIRGSDNVVRTRRASGDLDFGDWSTGSFPIQTTSKVTMEVHDGKLWQFVRGTNNRIYGRYSSDGLFEGVFSLWFAVSDLEVRDDVEAYSYNGTLYLTARTLSNEAYIVSLVGSSWVKNYEGGTRSPIYMEEFEDKLYFTMRGTDHRVYTKTYNSNTGEAIAWNYNTGGQQTYAQPTFGLYNGRLFQSVMGTDQKIYTRYTWQDQNWTGWVSYDGAETVGEVSM